MTEPFRIATAQYELTQLHDWQQYADKLEQWTQHAAHNQSKLLVFPEYAGLELTSLFNKSIKNDTAVQLSELQHYLESFLDLHSVLAKRYDVYIVAASFPVLTSPNVYHNRAHVFSPSGAFGAQDKLNMTRFEAERSCISGGNEIAVFKTSLGTLAINICYDAEFPLIAHHQVHSGAQVIIVPSCTDTLAGYHRVRIGCQARALENQCYVVQATTVGNAPWSNFVDVNIGAGGVFAPPDVGFPDNGVIALGEMNTPCWVYADIDLDKIDYVRTHGQVLNHRDSSAQLRHTNVKNIAL